jgi:hypothetical protein
MIKLKIKKSKLITQVAYHPLKATLIVTLKNGKKYSFRGVDHQIFSHLKNKKKPSKFFKKKIVGAYFAQEL